MTYFPRIQFFKIARIANAVLCHDLLLDQSYLLLEGAKPGAFKSLLDVDNSLNSVASFLASCLPATPKERKKLPSSSSRLISILVHSPILGSWFDSRNSWPSSSPSQRSKPNCEEEKNISSPTRPSKFNPRLNLVYGSSRYSVGLKSCMVFH